MESPSHWYSLPGFFRYSGTFGHCEQGVVGDLKQVQPRDIEATLRLFLEE